MRVLLKCAAAAVVAATATAADAAFYIPDGSTAPVDGWTRGDADSAYAEWDNFTSAYLGPNAPDVGESGLSTAFVTQTAAPSAFLIGGPAGNIYSFAEATGFDGASPAYGYGAGYNTRVVLQIRTLGTELDLSSVSLSYDGAAQAFSADYVEELDRVASGSGGDEVETLFVWDIASYNPGSLEFAFGAASSSMSLDKVSLDTFTQTSAFSALPVIPEPSSLAVFGLIGLTAASVTARRGAPARA